MWSNIDHSLISTEEEVFQEYFLLFWGSPETGQQHSVVPRAEDLLLLYSSHGFFSTLEVVWGGSAIGLGCTALLAAWKVNPADGKSHLFPLPYAQIKMTAAEKWKRSMAGRKGPWSRQLEDSWSPLFGLGYCILLSHIFLTRLLAFEQLQILLAWPWSKGQYSSINTKVSLNPTYLVSCDIHITAAISVCSSVFSYIDFTYNL